MTSITILDGADTIGGNKILLEEKGRGLLLDFGMNFARYGKYYQESSRRGATEVYTTSSTST
jgi:ribonuclease J